MKKVDDNKYQNSTDSPFREISKEKEKLKMF
jgi:hypothetical protein